MKAIVLVILSLALWANAYPQGQTALLEGELKSCILLRVTGGKIIAICSQNFAHIGKGREIGKL